MPGYKFRNFYIPERMMGGIERYINDHIRPGSFLCAVISNNLRDACGQADDENMLNLPAFVAYFYNEAPHNCWGSPEELQAWIDAGIKEGE
jgi:hypothetical protein